MSDYLRQTLLILFIRHKIIFEGRGRKGGRKYRGCRLKRYSHAEAYWHGAANPTFFVVVTGGAAE